MAKNSVADWDTTASGNTDIAGTDIAENCAAANLNDMGRNIMAQAKTKFDSLDTSVASLTTNSHTHSNKSVLDSITAAFTTADKTKLDGIEAGATADQTGSEIKALYEAENDTNAFTDADVTTLAGALQAANNLSDVASDASAVTNLVEGATPEVVRNRLAIFDTVADMVADTTLAYTGGTITVADDDIIEAGGFRYEVAASGASDQHLTTAGGVKLYSLPSIGLIGASARGEVGVSDDTTVVGDAMTDVGLVIADAPIIVNTGIVPGDGTLILPKPGLLTGTVSLAEAQAILFNRGYIGGVPMANGYRDKRFGIVAGGLRQNSSDPTQWDYINDSGHEPIGVSGTYATASGSTITLPFDRTYTQVGTFICTPDETLSNAQNMSLGASVGLSSALIKASIDRTLAITARYDGAAWQTAYGTGQGGGGLLPNLVSVANSGANVTVTHSSIGGVDVSVSPWTVGGAVVPKPVVVKSISNTTCVLNFIDPASWTFDTTADTTWAFIFQKRFCGGIVLDTADYSLHLGNIWFHGLMLID